MTAETKARENMSDALFSCLYRWVNGHIVDRDDTAIAAIRHPDDATRYGMLAKTLNRLVDSSQTTYEWLCDQGLIATDTKKQRENRIKLVGDVIGRNELKKQLCDDARIARVFPVPSDDEAVLSAVDRYVLGDGTTLRDEDVEKLEALNDTYTHVLAFGDHHIASMRANPVTGETHAFQTLNSFRNNFLDVPRVAGRRLGEAWLQWPGHSKRLAGVGFYPNPSLCPKNVYNLFSGLAIEPKPGDCSPYLNHLRYVICAGNDEAYRYLVGWLAHLFQKPEEKPSVAVVMKSIEGTGKGSMVRPIIEALGMYGIQVNGPGQIAGRFNGTIANKLFIFVDEAELTDSRAADRLKAIISEPTINLERKGKEPEPMPNYARFIFASNHDRVIRAGMRERRYLVLEPDGSRAQDREYFNQLYQWINNGGASHLLAHLLGYDLSVFDPRRPPVTAALVDEKLASLPPAYQYLYQELWEGKPFNDQERIFAHELVGKFMVWGELHGEDLKEAAARSAIGKVMNRIGMSAVGRSDRGQGKYYEIPAVEELQERFAALIGESVEMVFPT